LYLVYTLVLSLAIAVPIFTCCPAGATPVAKEDAKDEPEDVTNDADDTNDTDDNDDNDAGTGMVRILSRHPYR
jgi:hypothetical protein